MGNSRNLVLMGRSSDLDFQLTRDLIGHPHTRSLLAPSLNTGPSGSTPRLRDPRVPPLEHGAFGFHSTITGPSGSSPRTRSLRVPLHDYGTLGFLPSNTEPSGSTPRLRDPRVPPLEHGAFGFHSTITGPSGSSPRTRSLSGFTQAMSHPGHEPTRSINRRQIGKIRPAAETPYASTRAQGAARHTHQAYRHQARFSDDAHADDARRSKPNAPRPPDCPHYAIRSTQIVPRE